MTEKLSSDTRVRSLTAAERLLPTETDDAVSVRSNRAQETSQRQPNRCPIITTHPEVRA
ncbi:hypothetical protein ACIRRA_42545 [Nocardia sp. NPDC101769]|uniref:hypothetical protein n=1 Tax=Nocardia sp. NPDC101769 TaxID=3364333 RepID=UPI003825C603